MTAPPENPDQEGAGTPPPLQPFTVPSPRPEPSGNEPAPGYPPQPGYPPPPAQQPPAGRQAPPPGYPPPYGQSPYGGYQPYPGAAAPGSTGGKDPILAEWWQRLLARVIDGLVIAILVSPLWIRTLLSMFHKVQDIVARYPNVNSPGVPPSVVAGYTHAVQNMTASMVTSVLLLGVVTGVVTFCYDWLQHGLWGQTLGKRALGTKVVRADDRGRISGGAAAIRAAVYGLAPLVPTAGGLFALVNELWLTWDARRQCLHDKAAKTIVVKKAMLEATPQPAGIQPNSSV